MEATETMLTGQLTDVNQNGTLSSRDVTPLESQVAGHCPDSGKSSLGMLSHKDGYVLKPLLKPAVGARETEFYENLQSSQDPTSRELSKLVCGYHGRTSLAGVHWLVLDDVARGLSQPCVMDVKIGRQTWDPLSSAEKRLSEESKYKQSRKELAFCIPGYQVYDMETGALSKQSRAAGKWLDGAGVQLALRSFLNAKHGLSRSLVLQILTKLWKVLRWFRHQTEYKIYASSILLVYDAAKLRRTLRLARATHASQQAALNSRQKPTIGRQLSLRVATGPLTPGHHEVKDSPATPTTPQSLEDWHSVFDEVCRTHSLVHNYELDLATMKENYGVVLKDLVHQEDPHDWVQVKMIDFAHAYRSSESGGSGSGDLDRNYLAGLERLVQLFEQFLLEADC